MPTFNNPKETKQFQQEQEMLCYLLFGAPTRFIQKSNQVSARNPSKPVPISELNRVYVSRKGVTLKEYGHDKKDVQLIGPEGAFKQLRDTTEALKRLERKGLTIRTHMALSQVQKRPRGGRLGYGWSANISDYDSFKLVLDLLDGVDPRINLAMLHSAHAKKIQYIAKLAQERKIDILDLEEGSLKHWLMEQVRARATPAQLSSLGQIGDSEKLDNIIREGLWQKLLENTDSTAPSFPQSLMLKDFDFKKYQRQTGLGFREAFLLLIISARVMDAVQGRTQPDHIPLDLWDYKCNLTIRGPRDRPNKKNNQKEVRC